MEPRSASSTQKRTRGGIQVGQGEDGAGSYLVSHLGIYGHDRAVEGGDQGGLFQLHLGLFIGQAGLFDGNLGGGDFGLICSLEERLQAGLGVGDLKPGRLEGGLLLLFGLLIGQAGLFHGHFGVLHGPPGLGLGVVIRVRHIFLADSGLQVAVLPVDVLVFRLGIAQVIGRLDPTQAGPFGGDGKGNLLLGQAGLGLQEVVAGRSDFLGRGAGQELLQAGLFLFQRRPGLGHLEFQFPRVQAGQDLAGPDVVAHLDLQGHQGAAGAKAQGNFPAGKEVARLGDREDDVPTSHLGCPKGRFGGRRRRGIDEAVVSITSAGQKDHGEEKEGHPPLFHTDLHIKMAAPGGLSPETSPTRIAGSYGDLVDSLWKRGGKPSLSLLGGSLRPCAGRPLLVRWQRRRADSNR